MKFVCCLGLIYLAAVSHMMTGGGWRLDAAAVALVVAVRLLPPVVAPAFAFLLGTLLDGLGTGPFGAQAFLYVALAAVLIRCGLHDGRRSAVGWAWIVFWTGWWSAAFGTALELSSRGRWDGWEHLAMDETLSALATAMAVGVVLGSWRQVAGTPCTTH